MNVKDNIRAERWRELAGYLVLFLAATFLLVVLWSWCASALGMECRSVLTGEALRHFFRQPVVAFATWHGQVFLLVALAAGAVAESGLSPMPARHATAWWTAVGIMLAGLALLAATLVGTDAPLRSAAGRIVPSPFGMGFARALALIIVAAAMAYGRLSHRQRHWQATVALAYVGLVRYAPWLAVWAMAEINYATITYVFF